MDFKELVEATNTTKTGLIFNKEQSLAIEKGIEFIKKGDPNDFFLIEGKAGTGKTTVVSEILLAFNLSHNILSCAVSHKAKNVIEEVLNKYKISSTFCSIAGALGMDFDLETGRFTNNMQKKMYERPINSANIIIVDEGSMVNEEIIELIFSYKKKNTKVIFLGDIGQLPPIRSKENPYYVDWDDNQLDISSPIFSTSNKVKLTERRRQGEESPILPFADYFWDNSQLLDPLLYPTENVYKRESIINSKGALIFTLKTSRLMNQILDLYRKAIEDKNHFYVKFITYTNSTKRKINEYIHNKLYNNSEFFCENEQIIFNDNYGEISNSTETEIRKISEKALDKYQIGYYAIMVNLFNKNNEFQQIYVIDPESKEKHKKVVSLLFKKAQIYKKEKPKEEYIEALKEAWAYKKQYADIDYSYSITSHKSQGSTYNIAIVHEKDINSVLPTTNKSKSQSIYTAITRAKNISIIISDLIIENNIKLKNLNLLEVDKNILH